MYLKNTTKEKIKDIAHGGFIYNLPVGIFAIDDKAGEQLITKNFPMWSPQDPSIDKGAPLPPVIQVERDDWNGETYAEVSRFQMPHNPFPNLNLLLLHAKKMGVNQDLIDEWKMDSQVDVEMIVQTINELEIPEKIRFPESPDEPKEEVLPPSNKIDGGEEGSTCDVCQFEAKSPFGLLAHKRKHKNEKTKK